MLMKSTLNRYVNKKVHDPVAVILSNYNMPEAADSIAESFLQIPNQFYDLFLVDNGSDLTHPADHTTVFVKENAQTMGGWQYGLAAADMVAAKRGKPYFAYLFTITSTTVAYNPMMQMREALKHDPFLVGVSPALTQDSTTAWHHMKRRNGWSSPRLVWMIDNIFAMYRADWFDMIGRFDPRLVYAWGPDLETGYYARELGRGIAVLDQVVVSKETDIGYKMGRMNMTADERRKKAYDNMERVLSKKHGPDWEWKMRNEHVTDDLK